MGPGRRPFKGEQATLTGSFSCHAGMRRMTAPPCTGRPTVRAGGTVTDSVNRLDTCGDRHVCRRRRTGVAVECRHAEGNRQKDNGNDLKAADGLGKRLHHCVEVAPIHAKGDVQIVGPESLSFGSKDASGGVAHAHFADRNLGAFPNQSGGGGAADLGRHRQIDVRFPPQGLGPLSTLSGRCRTGLEIASLEHIVMPSGWPRFQSSI